MGKILIMSPNENADSISVHVHNAIMLQNVLGWDLVWDDETQIINTLALNNYDAIVFLHGTGREKIRTAVPAILRMEERQGKKARLYYIKNDYDLGENHILWVLCSQYDHTYQMITNNTIESETRCKKFWTDWHLMQINSLIYENKIPTWMNESCGTPMFAPENAYGSKEFGLMYYGTPRKGRTKYFKKYIDNKVHFSTTKKNWKKLIGKGIEANFIQKLKEKDLWKFKYTIYIEDEVSNKHYTHLANRFYECLMHDVLMFFDWSCGGTVDRSIYKVDPFFFVNDSNQLADRIEYCEKSLANFMEMLELQRVNKNMALVEREYVIKKIQKIVEND